MTLPPGCRFAIAPHFHLPGDWSGRLRIGTSDIPPSWRPPTPDELALLVRASDEPMSSEELEACVCLFGLPGHLRSGWWQLLEQAAGQIERGLPGFDTFVGQIVEFLTFKSLPIPEGACCDVLVSNPEERFVPWTASGRLWGGINLGDEETSILLIPQPGDPLRLTLGPGEGCRLPGDSLTAGGYPANKQEPDVLLVISEARRS